MISTAVVLTASMLLGQTYGDVAPVLHQMCAPCHRPGESAPFSLLTYEDARSHAKQIAEVTRSRYMPPWPPEPGIGDFAGARRLSQTQISMLENWAKAGAPAGGVIPAPPKFTEGWQLGEPDLIVRMRQPFLLPPDGADVFRNFILPVDLHETRYIRAIELRPQSKRAVHHANIVVDRTRTLRRKDGAGGAPGFPGMEVEVEGGDTFDPDSHFLFWKPGTVPQLEPEDMAWRIDPGADLVVNLHMQPTGKQERIEVVLGLYFAKQPPSRFPMLLQLEHDGAIDIPPGAREFAVTDHLKLPVAVDVLAIYPHAHYIGKRIEAWATLPGGGQQRMDLLRIANWDINWQASYMYRNPVRLPAGATVAMRVTYDNTGANPRSPSHPPVRVRSGDRSADEMGHVWLQVLPAKPEQRRDLQIAAMRRRLEKYPEDFLAHFNLGSIVSDQAEAVAYLEAAVRLQPASATGQNALAARQMAAGRTAEAIAGFRKALQLDPGAHSARYNLGQALASAGNIDAAITELKTYLEAVPKDGRAQHTAGNILAAAGRLPDAIPHFRAAAALLPGDADVHADLGTALAMTGDYRGAAPALERAIQLNPQHADAKTNLARVRALLSRQQ